MSRREQSHKQGLAAVELSGPEGPIGFTVSIGIADCADRALDDVLEQADKAMYAAKRAGRNRVALAGD